MKHIYRVVLSVSYVEVHFDFECCEDAVRFCTTALRTMTDREDGKNCSMVVKKINIEKELKEDSEEE